MTNILIWLYVCCGIACGTSFWKYTDSRRSIRISGSIIVGLIGPPLFPSFVFGWAINLMQKAKRDASSLSSPSRATPTEDQVKYARELADDRRYWEQK